MKIFIVFVHFFATSPFSQVWNCLDTTIDQDVTPCCNGYKCKNISDSLFQIYQKRFVGKQFYYWSEPADTNLKECYTKEIGGGKIISIEKGDDFYESGFKYRVREVLKPYNMEFTGLYSCGIGDIIQCRYPGKIDDESFDERLVQIFQSKPKGKEITKSKWPLSVCNRIESGNIEIGMTRDQTIASWGIPDKINRSTGSWGVHEQWIYNDRETAVYFENEILTSYQD